MAGSSIAAASKVRFLSSLEVGGVQRFQPKLRNPKPIET
jgi:hypothetical protein